MLKFRSLHGKLKDNEYERYCVLFSIYCNTIFYLCRIKNTVPVPRSSFPATTQSQPLNCTFFFSGAGVVRHRRLLRRLRNQQFPWNLRTCRSSSLWKRFRHPPTHRKILQRKDPCRLSW